MSEHSSRKGFTFKQFHVAHDKCAMKVGTDGVLLGAWAALPTAARVLDVGTGSGLISLMLAQRGAAQLLAIDIDALACEQAQENVAHSPWAAHIAVQHCALQSLAISTPFDLIVSNPPYFPHGQQFDNQRMLARHTNTLNAQSFFESIAAHSHAQTRIALIVPTQVWLNWSDAALKQGWHVERVCYCRSLPHKAVSRVLVIFSRQNISVCHYQYLVIEQQGGQYSEDFRRLGQNFYLNL